MSERKTLGELFSEEFTRLLFRPRLMWICLGILFASLVVFVALFRYNEAFLPIVKAAEVSDSEFLGIAKDVIARNSWSIVFLCLFFASALIIAGSPLVSGLYAGLVVLCEVIRRKRCIQAESVSYGDEQIVVETGVPPSMAKAMTIDSEQEPTVQAPTSGIIYSGRNEKNGKPKAVKVNDSFRNAFKPKFRSTDQNTGLCSYDILVEQLESKEWTISDLGRIALLIFESDILQAKHKDDFRGWMRDFFQYLSRSDCPKEPDKNTYKDFWKSNSSLHQHFSDLKTRWYDKTGNDYICFDRTDRG